MTPLISPAPGYVCKTSRISPSRQALRLVVLVVAFACLLVPTAASARGGGSTTPTSTGSPGGTSTSTSTTATSPKRSGGGGLKNTLCNAVGAAGPFGAIGAGLAGAVGVCGSSANGTTDAGAATSEVLKKLFLPAAGISLFGDVLLSHTLSKVPDYSTNSPGVVHLETAMTAIAFALLSLILTLSIIRYTVSGLSGGGGSAIDGVIRTFAAALLIVAWPFLFSGLISLVNAITTGVLNTHAVHTGLLHLDALAAGSAIAAKVFFGAGASFGWILGILIFGLNAILVVGLLLLKVALGATTTILFVVMPLALALWPLRETSWLAGKLSSVLSVAIAAPLVWALLFAVASVLTGSIADAGILAIPIRLLTAISTYVLAIFAPFLLFRQAHGGIAHPVGSFGSRVASGVASRTLANAASMQIPASMGGRKQSGEPMSQVQVGKDLPGGGRQTATYNGAAADAVAASLGAGEAAAREAVASAPEAGAGASNGGRTADERRTAAAAAAAAAGYPGADSVTGEAAAAGAGVAAVSAAQAGNGAADSANVTPGAPVGQTAGATGAGAGAETGVGIDGAGAGGGGSATPDAVEAGAGALGAGAGALTESALVGQGAAGGGSSWDIVSPGELGVHESAHAGALLDGAQKASPSLAQGTAAMDTFSPSMQSTFAGIHDTQGPGELRKVAAATALTSQQISDGERGGLTVLAGMSDQHQANLFKPGAPLSGDRSAPASTATQQPVGVGGGQSDPPLAPREQA